MLIVPCVFFKRFFYDHHSLSCTSSTKLLLVDTIPKKLVSILVTILGPVIRKYIMETGNGTGFFQLEMEQDFSF